MTESAASQPTKCPACGAASLSYEEPIDSWLCDECSYVIGSDSVSADTGDSSGSMEESLEPEEPDPVDWKSTVAVSDKSEQDLVNSLSQIEEVTDELPLSEEKVIRSGELMAEAWRTNFMHGRSRERTIGAAVYAASRESDTALLPAMIADELKTDKTSIKQTFQKLNQELDLDINPPLPQQFIVAFRAALGLPDHIEKTTSQMLKQHELPGGNPIGIAAGAIYISCEQQQIDVTLKQLANVAGLTKETVWRHTLPFKK